MNHLSQMLKSKNWGPLSILAKINVFSTDLRQLSRIIIYKFNELLCSRHNS
jgi:hypothetical protein